MLDDVSKRSIPNQRALARQIGVSVGLVNALLHRAVRKGLIKIKEAPARRYGYYLTPKGFAEKSRLIAEYLDYSLNFFRLARQEYSDLFARCEAAGRKRILLSGADELAEIASLSAHGTGIELIGIFDRTTNQAHIAGLPVVRDLVALGTIDMVVLTSTRNAQEIYEELSDTLGPDRVLAPEFLRVSTRQNTGEKRDA
ncbi:MAG TPA: MarR family transcriptional regulator [Stellaceae bacterium]|nr:MarR family transcriptional regulator [Stellaceae bacterium]